MSHRFIIGRYTTLRDYEPLTVSIQAHDTYVLPPDTGRIKVLIGDAWVSYNRQDIILKQSQFLCLDPQFSAGAAVTALNQQPIRIEIYPN